MIIDATFWVAIAFFIFFAGLIYLKVPHKINNILSDEISKIKKELNEADKLKIEAKNLLSNYETQIDKSKKEVIEIINLAKKDSENSILEKTEQFHQAMESKKKDIEQKISQMKDGAIREIKNLSINVSLRTVEHLISNSIDKSKLEKIYTNSLDQAKSSLKNIKF